MYKQSTINHIKKNGKLPLTFNWDEKLTELIITSVPISFGLILIVKFWAQKDGQMYFGFVLFLVGLLLLFFMINRIKSSSCFVRIKTSQNSSENLTWIEENIGAVLNVRNARINKNGKYAIASTNLSLLSWGESVVLICDDNDILINSIPSRGAIRLFKSKDNIEAVINSLNSAKITTPNNS